MSETVQPHVILFAGPVGSSKTPLAHMLSTTFRLPIINNDAIRIQTTVEHNGVFDQERYLEHRNTLLKQLLTDQVSFIYDASIDRQWATLKTWLTHYGYRYCIISIDITLPFITKQKQQDTNTLIQQTQDDHALFLQHNSDIVTVHITDTTFEKRFTYAINAISDWRKNYT